MTGPRDRFDLPRIGGYVFMGFGTLVVAMGIVTVMDDPAGFFAILFGLVFVAAGFLTRRLFAVPEGKKAVAVEGHAADIATRDGRGGTRTQSSVIHVDENATEAEVAAARAAWLRARWAERPDWAEGVIRSDDVKHGGLAVLAAGLWSVFALGALGAALIWGDIAWLVAVGAGVVALGFIVNAARMTLRRRKFGDSRLRLERTPLALGGRLAGEVATGVPRGMRLADGFAVTLRCVHRWEETTGSGDNRRSHMRRDTLWETTARHPGATRAGSGGVVVPVAFALPGDQPPATLGGGNEGIVWELSVSASVPGIDYAASFELPVLDRQAAEVLGR
jgi:hypothetical protein